MKVGYPVVLVIDGAEFAAMVCTAAPPIERPAPGEALADLVVDVAWYNPFTHTWATERQVKYINADELAPTKGRAFYEVGAPDPHERRVIAEEVKQDVATERRRTFTEAQLRGAELPAAECPVDGCEYPAGHDHEHGKRPDGSATAANGGYTMPPSARVSHEASTGIEHENSRGLAGEANDAELDARAEAAFNRAIDASHDDDKDPPPVG